MANPIIIGSLVFASVAMLLSTWRMLAGPDSANRAVALDTLTITTLPIIVWLGIHSGRAIYIDIALVYGVLGFIGVMALARFFDWGV